LEAYTDASYGGVPVTNGGNDSPDIGTATSRVVLPMTGHRLPQHNGSGICDLLGRGQGPSLGQAIPMGAPALGYQPHAMGGLGESPKLVPNNEVLEEEPLYRAPVSIPLSPTTGTTMVIPNSLHPWEGESWGSPNETASNDSNQQLEDEMDWDKWIRCFEVEA